MKKLVYFGLNRTRGFNAKTLHRLRREAVESPDPDPVAATGEELRELIEAISTSISDEMLQEIEEAASQITVDDVQACRRRFEQTAFVAMAEDARRACAAIDAERAARLAPRATRRKAA